MFAPLPVTRSDFGGDKGRIVMREKTHRAAHPAARQTAAGLGLRSRLSGPNGLGLVEDFNLKYGGKFLPNDIYVSSTNVAFNIAFACTATRQC